MSIEGGILIIGIDINPVRRGSSGRIALSFLSSRGPV